MTEPAALPSDSSDASSALDGHVRQSTADMSAVDSMLRLRATAGSGAAQQQPAPPEPMLTVALHRSDPGGPGRRNLGERSRLPGALLRVLMFSFPLLLCALMLGVQLGENDLLTSQDGQTAAGVRLSDDIRGRSESAARQRLAAAGYPVRVEREPVEGIASGVVLRTTPAEGAVVRRGTTVLLVVSVGVSEDPDTGPSDPVPPSGPETGPAPGTAPGTASDERVAPSTGPDRDLPADDRPEGSDDETQDDERLGNDDSGNDDSGNDDESQDDDSENEDEDKKEDERRQERGRGRGPGGG